jgi:hypothetical protein
MNSDYAACRELWGVIHSPLSIKVRCACALLVFLPSTFLASPVLAAPTPADDTAVVSEDSSATTIDVAANDGSDAVPTSVTLVSLPPNGTASNNGDGSFDYTPDLNHSGSDIFTYSICDLIPECATATVNIVVDPVNDAPVITGQASPLSTPEDQSLTIGLANLLVTDVDPDDVYPTGFSLQLQAGENYSFSGTTVTPAENFNGELDVTVFVTDPDELQSGTFDLAVSVLPINDLPIAVADTADVAEDSLNNPVEVLLNDFDPDGDTLSVTSFSAGNGTVSVLGNGTLRYTPDTNYFGADIIDYTISDGNGGTASTTVAVTVNPVPDFPVAADDVAAVLEDSEDNLIDVTANDSDPDGDTLTVTLASATNGSATPSNGSVNYTPNANFSGADTISYTISDGTGRTDTATVAVTVTGQNDPPVANDDVANVEEDSSTNIINVTENDTDPDGDTLTVSAASTLTGTVLPSGTDVVYTPPADFVGVAIINYTVSDGNGGTDDAIVTVTVSNQNDPPVAVDDVAVVTEDTADNSINVAANDSDQDGDLLTVSSASALNGTAIPNVSSVVYTPNTDFSGLDTISYTISDGNGGTDSATVAVTVSPLNDPPVIDGLVAPLSTTEDQSITITLRDLSVTDVDPDDVYPTGFTLQLNAGVNYTVSGNVVTPDENFSGQISVPATVTDPDGLVSQLFAIPITVTAVNDAPVANDDTATVTEDSSNNLIDVTANDTDDDGDSLSVIAASAANGTAAPSAGNVSYTPNPDFSGADTINYTISDGNGGTDTATVAVTVTAVNDAPVIIGLTSPLSTPEDQSITIGLDDLIVTDADLDDVYPAGFSLQLQDGANYTAVGTIVTPAENFNGQITVPATVTDPDGLVSQVFSIPITVTAVNDIPTLDTPIADQTAIENSPFSLDISGNFSDADGDTLTFSASGLPASNNITLNAATGVISGTPRIEDARDNDPYVVTVTARDPLGETTIGTFDLTISALDRANLALSIDVSPDTGLPNDDLRWTFTALNPLGPQPGSNVELRGSFVGSGLTVTAENGANCTIDPTVDLVTSFVCVLGTLPVGASTPTVITTTTSEATEVVAFATAAGAENLPIDPNEEDNSAVEAWRPVTSTSTLPVTR